MRRSVIIVGVLVIFAIIEIVLLIAVGRVIGAGWTLLLVLATSAIGGWLLRREGSRAWRLFRADLEAERPPGRAATEGLLVLVGGIFMVVPGFISDLIGALLLTPPTRRVASAGILRLFGGRLSPRTATMLFGPRHVRAHAGTARPEPRNPDPTITTSTTTGTAGPAIEGEIIDPR